MLLLPSVGAGGGRWRGMVAMAALTALGNLGAGCLAAAAVGESFSRLFLMREPITKSWFVRPRWFGERSRENQSKRRHNYTKHRAGNYEVQ